MKEYNISIKQWSVEDRPREKMEQKGILSLSNAELLAILLGTGTRKYSAVDLGKQLLLNAENNLEILGKQNINDLQKVTGIGKAKAISVMAAMELGRRRKQFSIEQKKIGSSQMAYSLFAPMLCDIPHEEFWVLYLNRANKLIAKERISTGGISGTVVDNRIIFKHAIEKLASGIILGHNHPSGQKKASEGDIRVTKKIKSACEVLELSLLDHIIVCGKEYVSFADDGML
jgi:DNA repair protein RadC